MVTNWNQITLVCGNHKGDDFPYMQLKEGGQTVFFACPMYQSIYGSVHNGRSCNNRISQPDFMKLIEYLNQHLYSHGHYPNDLTGEKFSIKWIDFEVLTHTVDDNFIIKMLNKRAIK